MGAASQEGKLRGGRVAAPPPPSRLFNPSSRAARVQRRTSAAWALPRIATFRPEGSRSTGGAGGVRPVGRERRSPRGGTPGPSRRPTTTTGGGKTRCSSCRPGDASTQGPVEARAAGRGSNPRGSPGKQARTWAGGRGAPSAHRAGPRKRPGPKQPPGTSDASA